MATQKSRAVANSKKAPKSADLGPVRTAADFASLMSSLMGDIISGRITPDVGNAACNAGGKLLKIVEMQYKYGTQSGNQGQRTLTLVPEPA